MPGTLEHILGLAPDDWEALERAVDRFERAWRAGLRPEIGDYLPPGEAVGRAALVELAHAELEFRLTRGEAARVEEYLHLHPELGCDRAAVWDLVEAEYRLRRGREPGLCLGEYLARFPRYLGEILALPVGEARDSEVPPLDARAGAGARRAAAAPGRGTCGPVGPGGGRPRLGKFELEDVLGRGSCGVVYRARDAELGRLVALKVPRLGDLASPEVTERFLREARSAAALRHPHIVAVYEAGRIEGTCYLATELIPGPTLADRVASGRIGPRAAAEMLASVAEALDFAHRRGVVHRDVKPANILLDDDDRPHVADFGLARRDAAESTLTADGQVLGTPAYMSPEQARGEARGVDGRCDVYGLGVVLYELLTGELPFRGDSRLVLHQILNDDPRPPRGLDDRIPRALETVCLKALAKEPGRRYPTAGEMADDLRRFLRREPIRARPVRAWVWAWARAGRRPMVAALIALLVLASGGMAWQWRRAEAVRERLGYLSIIAQAARDLEAGDVRRAGERLDRCTSDRRRREWHFLKQLCEHLAGAPTGPPEAAGDDVADPADLPGPDDADPASEA